MTGTGVVRIVRLVVSYEVGLWLALYRWVLRRRPGVGAGDHAFGYTRAVMPIMWTFIGVSAIEVPAVHLLLPWYTVRMVALAIGVYGLLWMVGLLASLRVYPHVVGDAGLRVRYGSRIDVTLPWEAVTSVTANTRTLPSGRGVQVQDGAISIVLLNQTHVDVTLRYPVVLAVAKGEAVTAVRIHADDPRALVARAREHLERAPATPPRG